MTRLAAGAAVGTSTIWQANTERRKPSTPSRQGAGDDATTACPQPLSARKTQHGVGIGVLRGRDCGTRLECRVEPIIHRLVDRRIRWHVLIERAGDRSVSEPVLDRQRLSERPGERCTYA